MIIWKSWGLGELASGALSLIGGKAKPENPIDVISKNFEMMFGTDTPFMQQMKEGFANDNIDKKWWIVPRGKHSVVEYAKEIDPSLVSFERAEVGSWYADVQGIVHKVAIKNDDTFMSEHYVSNEIPPAKTWIFYQENQLIHLMQAYNGEVLFAQTLNNDNTRTILAKNNGRVLKTTIDANGNATTTHEEAAKNIEFSKFLQESEGIETAGKGEASVVARNVDVESKRPQEIAKILEEEYPNFSQDRVEFLSSYIPTRFPSLDSKTAFDAWQLSRDILEDLRYFGERPAVKLISKRDELEQILNIKPIQEFGTNYAEHYHDGINAIQKVMHEQQGQVTGAFYRKELGDITITWGEVTDAEKHKGYGLAHIVDKHPDFDVNHIAEIVEKGKLNIQNDVRARLEYGNYVVGLSREFKGEKANFIITAFEKSNGNKGSLSPKPKITDESDNVSPTHITDSTPQHLNNSLENAPTAEEVLFKNAKAFPNRQDVHKVASDERNLELSQGGTSHNQSLDNTNSTPQPLNNSLENAPTAKVDDIATTQTTKRANEALEQAAEAEQALPDYAIDMQTALELAARNGKQRLNDNLEALRVLAQLENGAPLSKEAQEALGKYSGFGGTDYEKAQVEIKNILQSFPNHDNELLPEILFNQIITTTKNAYYTPHEVIHEIYRHLGFVKGRVLEPSMGIGNFFATMPESLRHNTQRVGIELDSVSAKIAQYLHPNARIENANFEDFSDNIGFDLIIGNPPYDGKMNGMPIVAAFLKKSLELTKENGIVVQVVSNAFLDNPASASVRAMIAKEAELLGAVRLPSDTFSGTSVATDIVVFQKRKGGGSDVFVGTGNHSDGTQSLSLNNYYLQHPNNVLGELRVRDTNYQGKRWSVEADERFEKLPEVLESIFKNRIHTSDAIIDNAKQQDLRRYTGKERNGALVAMGQNVYVVSAGDRFTRSLDEISWIDRINKSSKGKSFDTLNEAGKKKRQNDAKKAEEMARDYIALRDNLERLRKAELDNNPNMEDMREQLRECYHYFRKKHCNGGKISENRIFNAAFINEPSYWIVRDLDLRGEHKILHERIGMPIEIPTKAENLQDAIAISKTYSGKIDAEFLETLLDDSHALQKAYNEGELFLDNGEILTKEEYLSGDLGAKIDALLAKKERSPNEQNALKFLKEALPKPLDIDTFHYAPHSKWIPHSIMQDFLSSFSDDVGQYAGRVEFGYTDLTGWEVARSHTKKLDTFSAATQYMQHDGYEVLNALLHNKPLSYKKTINGTTYTFHEQYIANQKARDKLLQYFYTYMRENHRKELENAYNKQFSRMLPRKVSAGHFLPPNETIEFFPHQKEAIAFAMGTKNVLLDQSVGAGKTYEMVAMGAAFKRTGMAKRPAYAVPNHLVEQWVQSYHKLYPNANVVTIPTTTKERKETLAKIANSDVDIDAIIIPHSTLNQINTTVDFRLKILRDEIREIDMAENTYRSQTTNPSKSQLKRLENKKKAIVDKIKALDKQQTHNEENAIYFEDLKIDALFVDEAHLYKNIGFVSSDQTLRGLGSDSASDKARNLLSIVRQLQSRDGHVVFATGTPLVNSVSEVYAWQKYLNPAFLEKHGIRTYDDWLDSFGHIESRFERTPVGTYKEIRRLTGISNLDALSKSYAQFCYFTDVSQTHIKRPNVERISIEVESSEEQKAFMQSCLERYQRLQSGEVVDNDNYLNITNDGINCALDYRLIDKDAKDFEGSKLNRAVFEAAKLYKETDDVRGVQLIFLDRGTPNPSKRAHKEIQEALKKYWDADEDKEAALYQELEKLAEKNGFVSVDSMRAHIEGKNFSLYDDLRAKLIKSGVKENEIAFIHDYTTDAAKAELFAKVNAGEIRFLIGSTKKMGAGMNVQERIVGLHHIDAAWNPADLEQRDGRGLRQGNKLMENNPDFKLKVFYYLTKNSTDAIYYAKLEQKQASIHNFRSGHAIERSVDEQIEFNYAEFAAAISGDEREIVKAQLQRKLAELEAEQRGIRGRAENENKEKEMLLSSTQALPKTIEQLKADIEIAKKRGKRELSDTELKNLKEIGIKADNTEPLFVLDNYEVFLEHNGIGNSYRLCAISENGHEIILRGWNQHLIQSVPYYARELIKETTAESLAKRLEAEMMSLERKQARLETLQKSDFSKRAEEIKNDIAQTRESLENLIRGMETKEATPATKQEIERLENGEIIYKDAKGKEHTISKEFQEQWTKELGLESIEQDFIPKLPKEIGEMLGSDVHVKIGSLIKMQDRERLMFVDKIKPTLQEPDVVILQNDGAYIFAKDFADKKFFASVVRDDNGEWIVRSNAPKSVNNLQNKIKQGGKVVYGKLPESPIIAQSELSTKALNGEGTRGDSTPQNIKNGLENGDTDKDLHAQLKKVEQELAANAERIDKAMPEDKRKYRDIHRQLVEEKRRIKAELKGAANEPQQNATKALEALQKLKAEDRTEAMNANWDLANEVGLERFMKLFDDNKQKTIRDFIDSVMQRPDVEYVGANGATIKVKKVLDTSANNIAKLQRAEVRKEKDDVQYFIAHIDNKGQAFFNTMSIDNLKKELQEAKEIRLKDTGKTTLTSNPHAGSGIATGSIAGLEIDEQGNMTFDAEKFALGFLVGAAGSKILSNPKLKEQALRAISGIQNEYMALCKANPELFAQTLHKIEPSSFLKPQAALERKSREVFNKELMAKIEEAIEKGQVATMPKSQFENVREFRGLFDSVKGNRGIIKTPYQDVVVNVKKAFEHFTINTHNTNRENIKGGFFDTFREPLFVVEKNRGKNVSVYFYKPFYDEEKQMMNLFGIGIDRNGNVDFKTYYLDERGNRLSEMLNSRDIRIKYLKKWD